MRKILFVTQPSSHVSRYHVNPVVWMLRLYHKVKGKSYDQWQWLNPLPVAVNQRNLTQQLIQEILDIKPDVLCLSVYVWSRDLLYQLGQEIKKQLPQTIIIAGGPDIDGFHNPDKFYKENPWVDWCVFSAGESSFTKLLDHLAGHDVKLVNTSNNLGFVSEHEVFMDNDFMKGSPLLTFASEIKQHLDDITKRFGPNGYYPVYVWETVKGCPYKCSFCDWTNSGIGNKVRFWGKNADTAEPIWKQELDLMFDWRLKEIYWTNPNTGQTHQDEEIVDYWCEMKTKYPDGPVYSRPIMTKTQKQRGFRIFSKLAKHGVADRFYFSLQDLDPAVLENIDRPDIPWEEHKKLIADFLAESYKENCTFACELIWGMPGQTMDHFYRSTSEVLSLGLLPQWNYFQILPFSPAAKQDYQQHYGMTVDRLLLGGQYGDYCTSSYSMDKKTWMIGIITGPLLEFFYRQDKQWTIQHSKEIIDYVRSMSTIDTIYQDLVQNHRLLIPGDNNDWIGLGKWIERSASKIRETISTSNAMNVSVV